MSPQQVEVALRKQRLQMRSAVLRNELYVFAASWKPAFTLADRANSVLRWLRRHPAIPVAAAVAFLVARPRAVLQMAQRGFVAWQVLRKLRSVFLLALARSR